MPGQRQRRQQSPGRSRAIALGGRPEGSGGDNSAAQERLKGRPFSTRQAQEGLARLGFTREVSDSWDADARASLRGFQEALGLEPSGQLDPPTEAALHAAMHARVSFRELLAMAPDLDPPQAQALLPGVNTGMTRADASNANRKVAFLAQLAHESSGFARLDGPGGGLLPVEQASGWSPIEAGRSAGNTWSEGDFNRLADEGRFREIAERLDPSGRSLDSRDEWVGHTQDVVRRSKGNPNFFDAIPPHVVIDEEPGPGLEWGAIADQEADDKAPTSPPSAWIRDFL